MNYEEGSERSFPLGDGISELALTDCAGMPSIGIRDLAAESLFEFGSRVGFWRVMRAFEATGHAVTVSACAMALEMNDEAAGLLRERVAEGQVEVMAHGWRWEEVYKLDEEKERANMKRALDSLERTTGVRPRGWGCRYGPSLRTRDLLAEEGSTVYDSDYYGDELPFWTLTSAGSPRLVIPYSLTYNDRKFTQMFATGDQWFQFVKDAIDLLWDEGGGMLSVGLHCRLIGHPGRAGALIKLLDYVKQKGQIWVATRGQIADHWAATHPFDPAKSRL